MAKTFAYDSIHKEILPESKQALKVEFSFYFTQCLRTLGMHIFLKKWTIGCLLLKHKIYSSYRHQLFLYCGLLYILDGIDEADTLFVKDVVSLRSIRQKMKGHYMLLSLHFLKHAKIEDAQKYVEKSHRELWSGLRIYEQIALHNNNVLKNAS